MLIVKDVSSLLELVKEVKLKKPYGAKIMNDLNKMAHKYCVGVILIENVYWGGDSGGKLLGMVEGLVGSKVVFVRDGKNFRMTVVKYAGEWLEVCENKAEISY